MYEYIGDVRMNKGPTANILLLYILRIIVCMWNSDPS